MKKLINNQQGISNSLTIPLIGIGILTFALLATTIFLFLELDKAKNKRDEFATAAVEKASDSYKKGIDAKYFQKEKEPFLDFDGPELLGGITFKYPKTWSVLVKQNVSSTEQIDAYLHPSIIRFDEESSRSYALRLQLLKTTYSEAVSPYLGLVQEGKLKSKAVVFNGAEGLRLDGQLSEEDRGSMIILPIRDKTMLFWTESPDFVDDFNTMLETFKFNP
ncbi:hypothetical protein KBF61_01350 [Candidatus Saccharibacteria bacterium]|jgi:hypothetical protein|nr:hypothetical protein [Candidatus Saccharibacteria bacterium]